MENQPDTQEKVVLFQKVADAAREEVRFKMKNTGLMKNKIWRDKIASLQGLCAEVSKEIVGRLKNLGLDAETKAFHSPKPGGGNHIAVLSEDFIIDGTLDQYYQTKQWVWNKEIYPLEEK